MKNMLHKFSSLLINNCIYHQFHRNLPVLILSLVVLVPGAHAEDSFSVGFLDPTVEDVESTSQFYDLFEQILRATAHDLNIDLHITYGKNSVIRMRRTGLDLMKTVKPDYFLTGYYVDATDSLMNYTLKNPTKIFLITASPPADEVEKIGLPRDKYKNFIGQLTPSDQEFGYTEANYLINMAREAGLVNAENKVNVIAFGGFNEDAVADSRLQGLKERIAERNDAVLVKTTLAGWSRELAHKYTMELLEENPAINAIWAANDDMAEGSIEAAEAAGRHPGKDILIGGIDLSKKAIDDIENGKQAVSVGGQFMEAAWSLAMLYDYHHGIDFDDTSHYIFHSKAHAVTKDNAAAFRKHFLPADWNSIDFRLLTKTHNPDLKKYDFSLEAFQKLLEKE